MKFTLLAAVTVIFAVSMPATVQAGWPCSIDHAYPEVAELRVEGDKLIAILGNYFAETEHWTRPDGSAARRLKYRRLSLSLDEEWNLDGYTDAPDWWSALEPGCMDAPQDLEGALRERYGRIPIKEADKDGFNQSVSSCASDGINLWGGISFYGAEGMWGVGGLVKQDLETNDYQFIRPLPRTFTDDSTGPIAYFAGTLWMGSYWSGECGGPQSGVGLRKLVHYPAYDHYVVDDVPEVCGFAIRDFQEFAGALWVATELGLSKLVDDDGPRWSNYLPDPDHADLMREATCEEIYVELLRSKRLAETAGFDIGNAFDVFWQRLSRLRPDFAIQYLRQLHGHPTEGYPKGHE